MLKHFAEKRLSVCVGPPFRKMFSIFFSTFMKKHFTTIQDFFLKKTRIQYNKIKFLITRSSNCSVMAKFFSMLVETAYFEGVINPKTDRGQRTG